MQPALLTQLEPIAATETGYTIVIACLASACLGLALGYFLAIIYSLSALLARINHLTYIMTILNPGGNHNEPS